MRKYLKKGYLIIWVAAVIMFILIAVLIPEKIGSWSKKDSSFWASVLMMLLMLAGNLILSIFFFEKGTKEQNFLKLPVAYVSFVALGITFLAEIVCLLLPGSKNWWGIVVGLVILICYGFCVLGTLSAAKVIEHTEEKLVEKTAFLKSLRAEAEILVKQAPTEAAKKEAEKISQALRYSDPCSNLQLDEVEGRLYVAFSAFASAIKQGEEEQYKTEADNVLRLLDERNTKCKLLK